MRAFAAVTIAAGAVAASMLVGPEVSAQQPMSERSVPTMNSARTTETAEIDDKRGRRFWVRDEHRYWSPWYAGKHRKMINFGCTAAPYYDPSPLCRRDRGFHHGLDIAMPCGTRLYAGLKGRVLSPAASGSLGSAYGPWAFRIRNKHFGRDIGHVRRVYVRPGERLTRGQLIARASDAGAPDGCHLHFETRPIGGSYTSAVRPGPYLRLHR
jgi:murein DD-endopeptidase MepM/ murein hydrolase activator NlpD